MKTIIGLITMVMLGSTIAHAAGTDWLTDFEKAKKAAKDKGIPIIADFSGSDWCGWCKKLDKEVFTKKEFLDYAKDNVVLLLVDFPRQKKQSAKVKKQNEKLAKQYNVRGFPTVLLLDADGKVLAETGYRRGGAASYVKHLKELIKNSKK